jgi:hypothetical protein
MLHTIGLEKFHLIPAVRVVVFELGWVGSLPIPVQRVGSTCVLPAVATRVVTQLPDALAVAESSFPAATQLDAETSLCLIGQRKIRYFGTVPLVVGNYYLRSSNVEENDCFVGVY